MAAPQNESRMQYEKIHKRKKSRREMLRSFANDNIEKFDRKYLKIDENKRSQIREALYILISELNRLQHSQQVENKFDAIYLGGSFDSGVDLDGFSDVDISLMIHAKKNHREIQNNWSKCLETWFQSGMLNGMQGNFEYVRSHCNRQFENIHHKGIAIEWKNYLSFALNVDLLVFFRTQEDHPGNKYRIPGITILDSNPNVFKAPMQQYHQILNITGHNYKLAATLQVYFTMGNSYFVKNQPEVVKQVIRRYKYWQKRCKSIEIECQLENDMSPKVTRRLPSIALCYIVIHVFQKLGSNVHIDPAELWDKVLEHLKDISLVNRQQPWIIYFNEFYDFSQIGESLVPKSKNPLRIIDATRPDRDILQGLNNSKMWEIIPKEAEHEFNCDHKAASRRMTNCAYETYALGDYF